MLKVLTDLSQISVDGTSLPEAFNLLRSREGCYDPAVLDAAYACFVQSIEFAKPTTKQAVAVAVNDLCLGQTLLSNIETKDGTLLISAGNTISSATLEKVRNFSLLTGIKEPIFIEAVVPQIG
jgi:hypothetical protein